MTSAEKHKSKANKYKRKYNKCKQQLQSLTKICQSGLNCAICVDLLSIPHSLECGHLFCFTCLLEWARNCQGDDAFDSDDEANDNIKKDLTCPLCRREVKSAPRCAKSSELQINSTLELLQPTKKSRKSYLKRLESDKAKYQLETCQETIQIWDQYISKNDCGIVDLNDGVSRCVHCLWEIVDGYCSNCNLHYRNNSSAIAVETETEGCEYEAEVNEYLDTDYEDDASQTGGEFIDNMASEDGYDGTESDDDDIIQIKNKRQKTIIQLDDSETDNN